MSGTRRRVLTKVVVQAETQCPVRLTLTILTRPVTEILCICEMFAVRV
jgi:hypothetical protein